MGRVAQWKQKRRFKKAQKWLDAYVRGAQATARSTTTTLPTTTQKFSAEEFMRLDLKQLQRLAAELLWASPHAKGAMRQLIVLAMGTGLRLQALPNRRILGLSSEDAYELARDFESVFSLVRMQLDCAYDGTRPFNGVELLGFWSWLTWDEVFIEQRYRSLSDVVPVSAEVVNPACVVTPPRVDGLAEGHRIDKGIEIDTKGKHVAFWREEHTVSGQVSYRRVPYYTRKGKRVGIHVYRATVPAQVRGITRFMPIFHEMRRVQEALQLETDTMATNARLAAVWERDRAVDNPDKLAAIAEAGGDLDAFDSDLWSGNPGVSQRVSDNGGIIIQSAEPGEKLTPFDSKRPNVNVNEFILQIMTWIGPALGIPVELWRALFGKAYSASKGSIDLGYKSFEQEVFEFSRGVEQPYYEATISAYVASGYLRLPRWNTPIMKAAYLQTAWSGPPKPSLNPLQEEKAASERVNNTRSSNEREIQLSSGMSFDIVADRREYEVERERDIYGTGEDPGEERPAQQQERRQQQERAVEALFGEGDPELQEMLIDKIST
jgi:capsid protein